MSTSIPRRTPRRSCSSVASAACNCATCIYLMSLFYGVSRKLTARCSQATRLPEGLNAIQLQDVQGPLSTFLRNLGLSLPHEDARTIRFDTQLSALTSNAYRLNLKPDSQSTSWGIEMSSASRRWAAKVLPCSVVPLTYMFLFERLHSNSLMNASPPFMLLCLLPGERGALYTILDLPTSSSGCIGFCMKLRRTVLLHPIGQPVDPRVRVVAKRLPETGLASYGAQEECRRRMKTK
ncbi:hypothetical protein C8Q70DRAFT_23961 [Cubamyces menziesii]|nr:hypothetical protein C8Q70DRAFT_23961 [Cubamyces menziesii]